MGINAASKRIQGPFPLGPSKEWAEGISTSFGAFSKIYDYFGEGFMKDAVDPDEFARAIDTVATGINVASKRIQGPFPEGPSREWAKGTSLAFVMSPIEIPTLIFSIGTMFPNLRSNLI